MARFNRSVCWIWVARLTLPYPYYQKCHLQSRPPWGLTPTEPVPLVGDYPLKLKVIFCVRGVVSPLLANIYLHHVLDCWYVESVKPCLKGRTFLVRYADDFILGFEQKEDAERVYRVLFKRFEKYGLRLHEEKTRLVAFGRPAEPPEPPAEEGGQPGTFDFLGFTHYWGKSRKGTWVIRRQTSRKRFGRSLKAVSQWCRRNLHRPLREQVEVLGRKLKGYFGYYGITGNAAALQRYRWEVIRTWRRWLARRGDPDGMSWERMKRLLAFYSLPAARVVHSIYTAKP